MIGVALQLAQLIGPQVVQWVAGDKAGKAAQEVADAAMRVTGASTPEQALSDFMQKPELVIQFKTNVMETIANLALAEQAAITERHSHDMQSDNALSKNIRPLALIFATGVSFLFTMTDGNLTLGEHTFKVREEWITMWIELTKLGWMFYFGGRTIEKAMKTVGGAFGKK